MGMSWVLTWWIDPQSVILWQFFFWQNQLDMLLLPRYLEKKHVVVKLVACGMLLEWASCMLSNLDWISSYDSWQVTSYEVLELYRWSFLKHIVFLEQGSSGPWNLMTFHSAGNVIRPQVTHIFQRGWPTQPCQPPSRYTTWHGSWDWSKGWWIIQQQMFPEYLPSGYLLHSHGKIHHL